MAEDKPTQKQISNTYAGSADYPGRAHYLRRLRAWLFAVIAVAAIVGALAYSYLGRQDAYSPGPISQNHSRFASDCRACHRDADKSLSKLSQLAPDGSGPTKGFAGSALAPMDAACLECHATASLHLPQAASIGLRAVSGEPPVVHATGCASCHREHVGHDRMALPSQQTCVACHNDADTLKHARESGKIAHTTVAAAGENRNLGDGLVRFLTPARGELKPFASYADGHPPFAYEQAGARDPAPLKFNHERHLRADIPKVNNRRLDCADCHQAGADGVFNQPVKYAKHCAQCHTLQFQPNLPKMLIPHGDPEKVRYFLAGREVAFDLALRAEGISDPAGLKQRVQIEVQALSRRGLNNLNDLEQRVFFDGDPPDRGRLGRAGNPKFLTECAKCHEVSPGTPSHAPKVQRPTMAERWVQRGPFTHLPHQHMKCTDCHGAAQKSEKTSDILLPPQTLCAECHRAPTAASEASAAAPRGDAPALAAAQRASGGVKWDCTDCHTFHAPPDAQALLLSPPKPPGPAVAK